LLLAVNVAVIQSGG